MACSPGSPILAPSPALPLASERSARNTAWVGAQWLLALGLAWLAASRWRGPTDNFLVIGLVGVAPFLLLLAWPLAVVAARHRQRLLFALSTVLAVLQVVWLLDDLNLRSPDPAEASEVVTIRLATANLWVENSDPVGSVEAIVATDPDVIFLQEVLPFVEDQLFALPSLAAYEWRESTGSVGEGQGRGGRVVLSRWPLSDLRVEPFTDFSLMVSAVLELEGVTVDVHNVHAAAPNRPVAVQVWREQFDLIDEWHAVRERPLLVAGDFNATVHHQPFRALINGGLVDAHQAAGRGLGLSWTLRGVPLMRLDHVLVSNELEVLEVQTLPGNGSDHRPVVVTVRLR